jgi:hypothetical protein
VIPWLRRDPSTPRPPLAGRLIGLAVGVLALSLAAYVALDVLAALIPRRGAAGRGRRRLLGGVPQAS